MSKPHRWTLGLFDDGSGVWLNEWRGEYEYREWLPTKARPGPWTPDDCRPQFRGISNNGHREIPRQLAWYIITTWRTRRKLKKEGGWLDL